MFFKHGYPPLWLRPVTPWALLHFLDRRYSFCWANVATWKILGTENDWTPDINCREPYDYCGKFAVATADAELFRPVSR
jgi:hypothetical protein